MKAIWFISVLFVNVTIVTIIFYKTDTQAAAFLVPALSAIISVAIVIISSDSAKKQVGWLTLLAAALSIPATFMVCFLMIAFGGGLGPI